MASSKSWSSGTSTLKTRRHFSLASAEKSLPLVKRIVADVVAAHHVARSLHAKLEMVAAATDRGLIEADLERTVDRLQVLVDELRDVGCELKDYRIGLIDFVGRHQGREIYLCWKLGEERITHWHELHTGVAGRQPVSILEE